MFLEWGVNRVGSPQVGLKISQLNPARPTTRWWVSGLAHLQIFLLFILYIYFIIMKMN